MTELEQFLRRLRGGRTENPPPGVIVLPAEELYPELMAKIMERGWNPLTENPLTDGHGVKLKVLVRA